MACVFRRTGSSICAVSQVADWLLVAVRARHRGDVHRKPDFVSRCVEAGARRQVCGRHPAQWHSVWRERWSRYHGVILGKKPCRVFSNTHMKLVSLQEYPLILSAEISNFIS